MDKPKGWIKYWKKSIDDELYNQEPFDKWHAWTDLLLMADYEGKVITTVNALKIRWKWKSYKQVRAYLGKLKGKGMVTVKGKPNESEIFICKYWTYQESANAKNERKGQSKGQSKGKAKGQVRSTLSTEGGANNPHSGDDCTDEYWKGGDFEDE